MDGTRIGIILIMGLMAYVVRALPQIFFVGRRFPESWDRFLRYLSYALICSIISMTLFMAGPRLEIEAVPHRAVALISAIVVAYRTKSAVTGMIVGTIVVLTLSRYVK
jgi:branched-subunit amino acid transport protein